MPPIGLLLGNIDFSNMFFDLSRTGFSNLTAAKVAGAPLITYGVFINTVIEFLIIAFIIFLLVRQVTKMQKPAPGPTKDQQLLTEICDLLKK